MKGRDFSLKILGTGAGPGIDPLPPPRSARLGRKRCDLLLI